MNNINMTMVEGFLVKDPSFLKVNNNTSLCKFTIGNTRTYTKKEGEKVTESTFIDITTWARLANVCNQFLAKGSRVMVLGALKMNKWKDDEGRPRSRMYIDGREVNFLPNRQTKKALEPTQ